MTATRLPCGNRTARGRRCLNAATVRVTAGCLHEHVGTGEVCEDCAGLLTPGNLHCSPCYQADSHLCIVLGSAEPLATAAGEGR
ncbi:hypothetical protein [Thermomonospora umbrina]|uniref:Uncharacterized protein n=1 Tax=Thermomonospora umbrina TaxID=111806 RepID=A0A3D9SWN4_9ACTN|nr:hypothetical protein [Thermomonospora umbrina]REF00249.1 hypothetical protein DFJ69_5777 [Thermomonospora umbrina]